MTLLDTDIRLIIFDIMLEERTDEAESQDRIKNIRKIRV